MTQVENDPQKSCLAFSVSLRSHVSHEVVRGFPVPYCGTYHKGILLFGVYKRGPLFSHPAAACGVPALKMCFGQRIDPFQRSGPCIGCQALPPTPCSLGFGVEGLGFGVQGLGFRASFGCLSNKDVFFTPRPSG